MEEAPLEAFLVEVVVPVTLAEALALARGFLAMVVERVRGVGVDRGAWPEELFVCVLRPRVGSERVRALRLATSMASSRLPRRSPVRVRVSSRLRRVAASTARLPPRLIRRGGARRGRRPCCVSST